MKYLSIICMKEDREKLLTALQKSGDIMLCESEDSLHGESTAGQNMRRMEKLIKDVKPYKGKKPLFAENPEVEQAKFDSVNADDLSVADKMEELLKAKAEAEAQLQKDETAIHQLTPWQNLKMPLSEIGEMDYSESCLGIARLVNLPKCEEAAAECGAALQIISQDETNAYLLVLYMKGESIAPVYEAGFDKAVLPNVSTTASEALDEFARSSAKCSEAIAACDAELTAITGETNAPELLFEQYRAESEREAAPFKETLETVILEGWVPAKRVNKVEKLVSKVTDVYEIETRDPLPDEVPPSMMENKYLVSQFEGITNMFSVPAYGENDPNTVMAPWYWIIFGMMMGDAGYGLMMVVLGLILKKLMKPKGGTAKLFNVIIYSSITTFICGVLFGSYFGETWHPILFSPMDDPLSMLIVTIGVGVLHIFTGMITKMVIDIKDGRPWDAIFDQLSWMLLLSGLGMLFLAQTRTVGMILAGVGALTILLTAGRAKKGVFGKITGGLLGLYGVTNYLSDILSYSRILALSLATGVVGMVMNMLAGMVQGSVIGFIISLVIYAAGHVFNLVLGLLSAYVHASRLQYIEFFSKFYEGNGKLFKPFSIETKYINIKNNGGIE